MEKGYQPFKKPNAVDNYDEQRAKELALCTEDPLYFIENFIKVQHPTKGAVPFKLYEYQKEMLDGIINNRHTVMLCARQLGKTTVSAAYLLWYVMFNEAKTVLVVANKLDQAIEILDRIRFSYKEVPDYIRDATITFNKTSIEFKNGSKIVARATSPDSGRGLAISCVSMDTYVTVRDNENNIVKTQIDQIINDDNGFIENSKYEILTDDGFKDFNGFLLNQKRTFEVILEDGKILRCTHDHKLLSDNKFIEFENLKIGDKVYTIDGYKSIIEINEKEIETVVDLVDVKDVHSYYTNGILSHNCLYVDELSFVEPYLQENFWSAVMPVLSTGGKSIVTSTPNSDDDKFAQIWRGANEKTYKNGVPSELGINGYKPVKVKWDRHPDRGEEWANEYRILLGQNRFLREMECELISEDATLIDPLKLARLQHKEPEFITGQIRWFRKPRKNHSYFVALDPSLGTANDSAAIQVFEMPTMTQVAEWKDNKCIPKQQVKTMMDILQYLQEELGVASDFEDNLFWTFENNTIGEAIIQIVDETGLENFPGQLITEKASTGRGNKIRIRKGLTTTNKNKLYGCSKLKSWLDTDRLTVHSESLIHQLKNFVSSGASYACKSGVSDDLVMATVLCIRMIDRVSKWEIFDEDIVSDALDMDEYFEGVPFIAV